MSENIGFQTMIQKSSVLLAFSFFTLSLYASEQSAAWRYTLRPGDNLISFSKKHLINPADWRVLQTINQIKNPRRMRVGSVIQVPLNLVKMQVSHAEVLSISGDCLLKMADGKTSQLTIGQSLTQGSTLITKDNSKLVILFADGSKSHLNSNASMVLDTLSLYSGGAMVDTKLRLQNGQVETHANPSHQIPSQLQIITPSAIAAVRGTQFRVDAGTELTTQETLDGAVDVSAVGERVNIQRGFGTLAKNGEPPSKPVELLPAIDTSSLPKLFRQLPIGFELPNLSGAVEWQSQVASDAQFTQVVAEIKSQTQHLMYAYIPDGQYYLRVRAKDKHGIAGYDAEHAFTVSARPFAPVLDINLMHFRTPNPQLHWQPVEQAISYKVEIAQDEEFKQILFNQEVGQPNIQLTNALTEGEYFWRVASISTKNEGGFNQGPFSKVAQFKYIAPPPLPNIDELQVKVERNHVFVNAPAPIGLYQYQVILDNPKNQQVAVWQGARLAQDFDFALKEFGKQVLRISYIDGDGLVGPAAIYEFDAYPQ